MKRFIGISLVGVMALPLAAQDTGLSVGGGVIAGLDGLKKATNSTLGFTANVSYEGKLPAGDIAARIGLGYAIMPGKTQDYALSKGETSIHGSLKTSLSLAQLTGDILIPTGAQGLTGVVGASVNSYSVSKSGTEDTSQAFSGYSECHFPIKDAKGLKLGFRLGFEYAFTKSMSADLLLQQTELSGANYSDKSTAQYQASQLTRRGGINPSWIQLGIRYHF